MMIFTLMRVTPSGGGGGYVERCLQINANMSQAHTDAKCVQNIGTIRVQKESVFAAWLMRVRIKFDLGNLKLTR